MTNQRNAALCVEIMIAGRRVWVNLGKDPEEACPWTSGSTGHASASAQGLVLRILVDWVAEAERQTLPLKLACDRITTTESEQ
jgi:hypothetical protein